MFSRGIDPKCAFTRKAVRPSLFFAMLLLAAYLRITGLTWGLTTGYGHFRNFHPEFLSLSSWRFCLCHSADAGYLRPFYADTSLGQLALGHGHLAIFKVPKTPKVVDDLHSWVHFWLGSRNSLSCWHHRYRPVFLFLVSAIR